MPHAMSFNVQNENYLDNASSNKLRMLMQYLCERLEHGHKVTEISAIVPLDPIEDPKGLSILITLSHNADGPPIIASEMKKIIKQTIGPNAHLASTEEGVGEEWEVCVNIPIKMSVSVGELNNT